MPFVWRRGRAFHFRRRLPKKLTELGAPACLCLSLQTEVLPEAMKRAAAIIAAIERVDGNGEGGAGPALPQPDAVRAGLYSVTASAVGRPMEVRAYDDRIELRQDGRVVGQHCRILGVQDASHPFPDVTGRFRGSQ